MIYFNLIIDDKTDFSCLELDFGIQHLEVRLNSKLPAHVKKHTIYDLKKFLFHYVQKTRRLRILDLRKIEELGDVYLDIWSIYEIYYPLSVKNVRISDAQTLRFVSAMGAESISISNSPHLEYIEFGKKLRKIYLPCTGIREFMIPQKCELEYSNAFMGCKNLHKIDLSNCVDLKSVCFSDCHNLTEITLSNSIKYLDVDTFKGCRNLKIIKGGKQIEEIDKKTFEDCNSLEFIADWKIFKPEDKVEQLANLYFTKEINNQVGIVIYEYRKTWILWDFCNKKYYLMKDRLYNTDGCNDYYSSDGGGEIIDNVVKLNDIVIFDIKESPIIERSDNEVCLLWESQCTNIELKGKLFHPRDGLSMNKTEQTLLLEYFSNVDSNNFCERTKATIEKLNIDAIINSYDISYRRFWQVRPGRDDYEWFISKTNYIYSDSYLETLLPIEEGESYSNGCKPLTFDEEKENLILQEEAKAIVSKRKKDAKEIYSKFKHYNYLVKAFFEDRTKLEVQFNQKYRLDKVRQYISPICHVWNDEDVYTLIHTFHYTDFSVKSNILDGYEH